VAERGLCHFHWLPRIASCEFTMTLTVTNVNISVLQLYISQFWCEASGDDDMLS
jgi:hypothetical protein